MPWTKALNQIFRVIELWQNAQNSHKYSTNRKQFLWESKANLETFQDFFHILEGLGNLRWRISKALKLETSEGLIIGTIRENTTFGYWIKNHFFENRRQTLKLFKFLVSNFNYLKNFLKYVTRLNQIFWVIGYWFQEYQI